jgi:CDGSH-type Zn-finger protein
METPQSGFTPIAVDLEEGKNYAWCACGKSSSQPFCDGSHAGSGITPKLFKVEKAGTYHLCTCKKSANAPYCDGTHRK